MNEFPLVFDLCVSRIDLSLYQKYIYNKQLVDAVLNIRDADKKVLTITPEDINDEGRLHFMNLRNGGFATFVSDAENWDPEDIYFRDGRAASKRGMQITRVFVIKSPQDLKRKLLLKQMQLDYEAGIEVRIIKYADLQAIKCEEDFGIWDNSYVCILHRDDSGKLFEGVLDSRVKSILTAQNWRDRIIRSSTKVTDVNQFL
jgi:hypothetical protein